MTFSVKFQQFFWLDSCFIPVRFLLHSWSGIHCQASLQSLLTTPRNLFICEGGLRPRLWSSPCLDQTLGYSQGFGPAKVWIKLWATAKAVVQPRSGSNLGQQPRLWSSPGQDQTLCYSQGFGPALVRIKIWATAPLNGFVASKSSRRPYQMIMLSIIFKTLPDDNALNHLEDLTRW